MDYTYPNLEIFYILNEYSVYVFICLIFGIGTLLYYLSIKTANPIFDSPKLSKKKPKKEKPSRSKNVKIVPQKILQTKAPEIIDLKQAKEIIDTGKEPTDDEGNTTWLPVVKSKKNSKTTKVTVSVAKESHQKKVESVTVQTVSSTIDIKGKPKSSVKYESKSTVIEHICDKTDVVKPIEIVQIDNSKQPENILPVEDNKNTIEELRNVSESPTNSLSDDFELIDVYKTSSEDGLKMELELVVEDVQPVATISSTSGASRKKNKKQQKLISKQLIEAAAAVEDEQKLKSNVSESKSKSAISSGKKKRPRKEY